MNDKVFQRRAMALHVAVQGIGLRPFVFQLSNKYQLTGFVKNTDNNVWIEWQGTLHALNQATKELEQWLCANKLTQYDYHIVPLQKEHTFTIAMSEGNSPPHSLICPDRATCPECIAEMCDPKNRRYQYPFISCTHCGPRYTICHSLPYDRHTITMSDFEMCATCYKEYTSPHNRRFYAQTISCWECGPKLHHSEKDNPLNATINDLKAGKIVALKGIGGFHLIALASNDNALKRLRERKHRPDKPFALMVANIENAKKLCELSILESEALGSYSAPIVIARRVSASNTSLSSLVAPNQIKLGVMLAYTPLHHLIINALDTPLVVTSANRNGEPICYQDDPFLKELADSVLTHNRKIVFPLEDSVVHEAAGKIRMLRRARGYTPGYLPSKGLKAGLLSVGGHLKSTLALSLQDAILVSPHLGDLDSLESERRFHMQFEHFQRLTPVHKIIQDYHPTYASTQLSQNHAQEICAYPHHLAHIAAVMAEHQLQPPLLGFAWDGLGISAKGEWWGGETLAFEKQHAERVASLYPIKLLGNEKAIKEPRRIALSLIHTAFKGVLPSCLALKNDFDKSEWKIFLQLLGSPTLIKTCSSMGRLFDGIAYLLGGPAIMSFEAQAAMMLENKALQWRDEIEEYSVIFETNMGVLLLDWRVLIKEIILDIQNRVPFEAIGYKFHCWCAKAILLQAQRFQFQRITLSGGVFQNALLTELTTKLLHQHHYSVYTALHLPPNDGGLSVGQLYGTSLCV